MSGSRRWPATARLRRIRSAAAPRSSAGLRSAAVDLVAQLLSRRAGGLPEILVGARIENAAGRADDEPRAIGGLTVAHGKRHIAALRAHSWHQEWHLADDFANFSQLTRIGGSNNQQTIAS